MARSKPRPLTASQHEIMNIVWDRGSVTISEVWKALCEEREVARNTVLTQVQRLEERGWLRRRREGRTDVYESRVPREASEKERLRSMIDQVFDGSAVNLVQSLLGHDLVDRDEIDRIRSVIEDADGGAPDDTAPAKHTSKRRTKR